MNFSELFNFLYHYEHFKTVGEHLDYDVYVDENDKKVRLMFQHTNGNLDWKTNFTFPKKPYRNQKNHMYVHGGWIKQYKSANDLIMNEYIEVVKKYPDYKCEINGFSMGAALAQIAAEDFYFRTGIKPSVVAFGCPKPFFGKKTRKYVESCIDIENSYLINDCNDIVSKVVPFIGWKHMKDETKVALEKKCFFKLFNAVKFHTNYDKENYENI